jgi:hypothetical protein
MGGASQQPGRWWWWWVGYYNTPPLAPTVAFLSRRARVCFSSIPPPLPDLTASGPEAKKPSLSLF